jgi:hypothetical protein
MEIGEASASEDEVASSEHDESCYFCRAKKEKPKTEVNDLSDNLDEDVDLDGPPGGEFQNHSGKLGKALLALGAAPSESVTVEGETYEVMTAAHHLIPGNASLRDSQLFDSPHLWKDREAKGNIGYNVNSAPNGVWSPGNYAVRPWSSKSKGGKSEEFKRAYAFAAMRATGTQFHDAHGKYSVFVRNVLNKINNKLDEQEDLWCLEAKRQKKRAKSPEERRPLYPLVGRLHTVSARMSAMLTGGPVAWKRNVWTSTYALDLMKEERPHLRAVAKAGKSFHKKRGA